ncbi:amidohydrolase [Roseomonas frigidaquae]|uniref:Amidohydrolase n=1 Tax=Falsiroseomonas frigidaquae TaxID=487318 RepID=A0ABX1ETD6_9PROT|nr:amidohydrolase [Falsiroseomonas frigidaquae]NKE43896.1 amidohydrolase [Falsiroseomonas frigidaquae]
MTTGAPGPHLRLSTPALLAEVETVYRDLHAHPELSMQEKRTAGIAADWLRTDGYEVATGIGGTGVVGLLRNGDGPAVLLRADMDALPVKETTGLDYASSATGTDRFGQPAAIAHACGHDMHVAWLMGATRILAEQRETWRGTVMAVFQPGEETAQGARAMIEDGMVHRFPKPDVVLGQHVVPAPAGSIGWRSGIVMAGADSLEVTLFGRGAHGSMPQRSIDPVVMAAATVMRLQTVVSREVAMADSAVLTVGTLQAGRTENIIPDDALLRLNVRTFNAEVRSRVLAAIRRIVAAEAEASGAPKPPDIQTLGQHPILSNDDTATRRVVAALTQHFGAERIQEILPASASEDFGLFGAAWGVPSVYWFIGGIDAKVFEAAIKAGKIDALPVNHAPDFAPVIHPTLGAGIEALVTAAKIWLATDAASALP